MARRSLSAGCAALLGAALLGGCVGKELPETRYYLLGAIEDPAPIEGASPAAAPSVEIAALRLPQYLERAQLVTRVDANRLAMSEYDKWGGNLSKNVARVLAINLSTLLASPDVDGSGRRSARGADVRVEVELLRFERGPDDRAHLDAHWRVAPGERPGRPVSRITRLSSEPIEPSPAMDSTVAAMSALLGGLSREIAAAILEQLRG